jgi:hypothetical protein
LKHVRADVERFLSEVGYDPVANERGHIPYGSEDALEEYCYREIQNTDILISIIGGRYGSPSASNDNSISQIELKTAVKLSRQVYIFVDSDVKSEFRTYKINKDNKDTKYAHVDNVKIFEFLEDIEKIKVNNATFGFRESSEIISILREQFAGLFQHLLRNAARQEEIRLVDSLKATSQSLEDVVKYLKSNNKKDEDVVSQILLPTHPLFSILAEKLDVRYRIYFQNIEELTRFLKARGYDDDIIDSNGQYIAWYRVRNVSSRSSGIMEQKTRLDELSISRELFGENGELKPMSAASWRDEMLVFKTSMRNADNTQDIPF